MFRLEALGLEAKTISDYNEVNAIEHELAAFAFHGILSCLMSEFTADFLDVFLDFTV